MFAALDSKAPKAEDIEEEDDDVPGRISLEVVNLPLRRNASADSRCGTHVLSCDIITAPVSF